MSEVIIFFAGAICGVVLWICVCAVCAVASDDEDERDLMEYIRKDNQK